MIDDMKWMSIYPQEWESFVDAVVFDKQKWKSDNIIKIIILGNFILPMKNHCEFSPQPLTPG